MSTEYYQKNNERLRKQAREGYQNLSEDKKTKNMKRPVKGNKIFRKKAPIFS